MKLTPRVTPATTRTVAPDVLARAFRPEAEILRGVLLAVSAIPGVVVWRQNSGLLYAPDGRGGFRRVRAAMPGAADISGILPGGRRLEIECKAATGKLRQEQVEFGRMVLEHGGCYLVVQSEEEAVAGVLAAIADGPCISAEPAGGRP